MNRLGNSYILNTYSRLDRKCVFLWTADKYLQAFQFNDYRLRLILEQLDQNGVSLETLKFALQYAVSVLETIVKRDTK